MCDEFKQKPYAYTLQRRYWSLDGHLEAVEECLKVSAFLLQIGSFGYPAGLHDSDASIEQLSLNGDPVSTIACAR